MGDLQSTSMDFKLRPWNITDLDCLVKYANNHNISKWLTDAFPFPYTYESGRHFIIKVAGHHQYTSVFAIEIMGEAAGSIGIYPKTDIFHMNAALGYWLAEPFWGRGITTAAIRKIVHFTFTRLAIKRIYACPFGSNVASQRVLEKAGFVLEARIEKIICKNNQLFDELTYGIRKEDWAKNNNSGSASDS